MRAAVLVLAAILLLITAAVWAMTVMPGRSFRGPLPPLTGAQRALATVLRADVLALTAHVPRSVVVPENLRAASEHIEQAFASAGYRVAKQTFETESRSRWSVVGGQFESAANRLLTTDHRPLPVPCENLEVEIRGATKPDEIVVIGAHYDTVDESPGADDNASGVAALLALARRFASAHPARTLRFVAFVNEEPPHFKTESMGSWRYAKRAHERGEQIVAMLCLESVGVYSDAPGSQHYPPVLSLRYPDTASFIAFAGNLSSRSLVARATASFRRHASFPSEGAAVPELIREIGWSDQWSFWQFGYPAIMATDTALFRHPHYHMPTDVPETLDYERMARVVEGLGGVVDDLSAR